MPNRNTLALVVSGLIVLGFFVAGILNILDYFIVKAILFLAFGGLAMYLIITVSKTSQTNNKK